MAQETEPYTEYVDVEITNVDAFVRDSEGRPVTGLSKEVFALYENGLKREIVNFAEFRAEPSPPESHTVDGIGSPPSFVPDSGPTKLVIFFDNLALGPFSRDNVLEAARELVVESTSHSIPVMMMALTTPGTAEILAPFSTEEQVLFRAIDSLEEDRYLRPALAHWVHASFLYQDQKRRLSAIERSIHIIAGIEGRKAMLLFLGEMPRQIFESVETPEGREQEMSRILSSAMGGSKSKAYEKYEEDIPPEQVERFNALPYLRRLVAAANEGNITLYPMFGQGLSELERGLSAAELSSSAAISGRSGTDGNRRLRIFTATQDSFSYLANETGGLTTGPTSVFSAITSQLANDLTSFYSLGFRSGADGSHSTIRVVVNGKGYTVRSRRSLYRMSDVERGRIQTASVLVAGDSADEILSNRELDFDVGLGKIEREGRHRIVSLELTIPLEQLSLVDGTEFSRGGITIMVAAKDHRDQFSPVQQQDHDFALPESSEADVEEQSYTYTLPMRMKPGDYELSVRLLDRIGRTTGSQVIRFIVH